MASADSVRASRPCRSIAASSTRQFITVASMPIVSPTGRGTPRDGHFDAAEDVAAADDDAEFDAELGGRGEIGGDALDGFLVDAEAACRR